MKQYEENDRMTDDNNGESQYYWMNQTVLLG